MSIQNERLELHVLGGFSIYHKGDRLLDFVSRKAEALLIYLMCHPQEHSREVLATLLWDELPQKKRLGNLRILLSHLRKQLSGFLNISRQTISFRTQSVYWLDLEQLEVKLQWCQQHPNSKVMSPREADALREQLMLYKGHFLEGYHIRNAFTFTEWIDAKRAQLKKLTLSAMQKLIGYFEDTQTYEAGIEWCHRALRLDTLQESVHRQLMRMLLRNGQRSAAFRQYELCKQLLEKELGCLPEEATQKLHQELLSNSRQIVHHLPAPPSTPIVGRHQELASLFRKLRQPECRLLTVIGPGGIGKTRLVTEFAQQLAKENPCPYPQGVHFISLIEVQNIQELLSTLTQVLQLPLQAQDSIDILCQFLHEKKLLLILDNFEQLLSTDFERLIRNLLQPSTMIRCLITSREPLQLVQEWTLTLEGLTFSDHLPHHQVEVSKSEALQLFSLFARRCKEPFPSSPEEEQAAIQICQLVEGNPLALELSASWLRALRCVEIAQEIQRDIDFLSSRQRNVAPRHRSMRVVFETSWKWLEPNEQEALKQLACFSGGFSQEAALEVSNPSLFLLSSLVEKSMLGRSALGQYHLRELFRQFVLEHIEVDRLFILRKKHCAYYLDFLFQRTEGLYGAQFHTVAGELKKAFSNIRAAWYWAVEQGEVKLLSQAQKGLARYCLSQTLYVQGAQLFSAAVDKLRTMVDVEALHTITEDSTVLTQERCLTQMLTQFAAFDERYSELYRARQALQDSIRIQRKRGFIEDLAFSLFRLGTHFLFSGHTEKARIHLDESLQLCLKHGFSDFLGYLYNSHGILCSNLGDNKQAKAKYEESLAVHKSTKDVLGIGISLSNLGAELLEEGDFEKAKATHKENIQVAQSIGDQGQLCYAQLHLGELYNHQGQFSEARALIQEVFRFSKESQDIVLLVACYDLMARLDWAQGSYPQADIYFQKCLSISRKQKNPKEHAFSMVLGSLLSWGQGEYTKAVRYADAGILSLKESGDPALLGRLYGQKGLSCLALQLFEQAESSFQRSLTLLDFESYRWRKPLYLCGLARLKMQQKDHDSAKGYLQEALQLATPNQLQPLLLMALTDWVQLHECRGQSIAQGASWLQLTITHPASWHCYRLHAQKLYEALTKGWSQAQHTQAKEYALSQPLQEHVSSLLNEIENTST